MEDSGIDSDPKTTNHVEDERIFLGSDSSCSSNQTQTSQHNSTTKQLQKKLEARIEQAKRIQRNSDYVKLPKYDKSCGAATSAAGLISIQRLPVPNKNKEHLPLVEYWHSDSESEGEMTLFRTTKSKDSSKHKQDLTDTFSIEEMSEESEDSLNLGPAQPSPELKFMKSYKCTGDCFRCQCHIL
ncbi:uncharacterized protein LOC108004233 [Apis cerana]|uniref:Uncharacterized protein LOC102654911 n=2 Tax=Apis TaxID=7459 RepID=A0A7M7GTG4_APIME|nr:uncharacterized protein LOC102654911 [Apis mellifera]XP_016922480.1 uncharacterized protein LOC108004233 [Apis cerana]KAG6797453.1 hypothetical protein HZU73_07273 [Apis mellifera caucasica]KAG9430127.1 hypothetical protein HZU67_08408 [Apis mellifera carnica]|eukprot:XP_006562334.1 uncharacterized protein LOC102654911 [Apis mellifera]